MLSWPNRRSRGQKSQAAEKRFQAFFPSLRGTGSAMTTAIFGCPVPAKVFTRPLCIKSSSKTLPLRTTKGVAEELAETALVCVRTGVASLL